MSQYQSKQLGEDYGWWLKSGNFRAANVTQASCTKDRWGLIFRASYSGRNADLIFFNNNSYTGRRNSINEQLYMWGEF